MSEEIISVHGRRDDSAYPTDPNAVENRILSNMPSIRHQQQARIDDVYAEMTETANATRREVDLMTEARTRFAKAALYEQIIEGMLFEGEDNVTLEVENEFKEFAESRLRVLLGIESEKKNNSEGLEDDEVTVLKLFAAKLLGRPISVPRPEMKASVMTQPRVAPPPPTGQLAQPKRGRGRPPGTGKHQRAAQPVQQQTQPAQALYSAPRTPTGEKRVVTLPNGQQKEVTVQKGAVKPSAGESGPRPVPMPSPDEMVAKAMIDGEMAAQAMNSKIFNK